MSLQHKKTGAIISLISKAIGLKVKGFPDIIDRILPHQKKR